MATMTAFTFVDNAQKGDKALHGGKGAGLLQMTAAGLAVPEALILTTEAWHHYRQTGALHPLVCAGIQAMVDQYPDALFSVRSGAPISMPGMMDTVLNVGATPGSDAKFPGAFPRFVTGWLEIVHGVDKSTVGVLMQRARERATPQHPDGVAHPGKVNDLILRVVQAAKHIAIPTTRYDQVAACVEAVFRSWDTPRARAYRAMHGISETMGTGCVVQRMVMGTAPGLSGSGVMFTRDPATGANRLTGEIAFNAQGEEVVSGAITPTNIATLENDPDPAKRNLSDQLVGLALKLEAAYGDVQDIEFTVESGKLYVLQTRTAKMSARARIITAVDLCADKSKPAALMFLRERVRRSTLAACSTPTVQTSAAPLVKGLAASPGAISGKVAFRNTALPNIDKGCILVAEDTAPEDFPQMAASGGILTATGGFTCHSAVVARGIGVPAVVGAGAIKVGKNSVTIGGKVFKYGDTITIDGATGAVYAGAINVVASEPPQCLFDFLVWMSAGQTPDAWWINTTAFKRVALVLPAEDLQTVDRRLQEADRLRASGKTVGFIVDALGAGEDLLDRTPAAALRGLVDLFGPDLKGQTLLRHNLPEGVDVAGLLGMVDLDEEPSIRDLLHVLEP